MTQRSLTSLDNAVSGLRSINETLFLEVYKEALEFYIDKLIMRHFMPGYGKRSGWTANSPKYQEWKLRKYGNLPQLVLFGKLRSDAKQGNINKQGKKYAIRWRRSAARSYGQIQINKGRDWATPSNRDSKDIIRYYKKEFAKMRAKEPGVKIR